MTDVYVGLGSNLGDRTENLSAALGAISLLEDTNVLAVSNVVESEPWGVTDQPPFANAVAHLETRIQADTLLDALKDIEASLGRESGPRNGPRVIDLDILLYGDYEWNSPSLVIPHTRLLERDFVVTPLLEIAPHAKMPDGTPITPERATEGRVVGTLGPIPGFEALTPPVAPPGSAADVGEWEEVASERLNSHGGITPAMSLKYYAAVLMQAGIPVAWDPMTPEEEYSPWVLPRVHRLLVPPELAAQARALIEDLRSATPVPEEPDTPPE